MLTLYHRHFARCHHKSRRERRCKCPLWVQGVLAGKVVRRALDLTSWDAATAVVRAWEVGGQLGATQPDVPTIAVAITSYVEDCRARGLKPGTLRKTVRTLQGQLLPFLAARGVRDLRRVTVDDLRAFRASLDDAPNTQAKKIERLRTFFFNGASTPGTPGRCSPTTSARASWRSATLRRPSGT